jgi:DNA-binding beta-propeller fold protein YncE
MKPNHLIALAVTAGIIAAAVSAAGCSKTSPGTPPTATATHATTTEPSHSASNPSQVVLPFTGLNRPLGVAVDAAGNVYVTDPDNNRVLKLPAGLPPSIEASLNPGWQGWAAR